MTYLTEEMFASGRPVAQGEVLIWMKKYAPKSVLTSLAGLKNMQTMKLENGQMILGHSESGHHHVLEPVRAGITIDKAAQAFIDAANNTFIELTLHEDCKLVHQRGHDTHGTFVFPAGEYIRGIREEQSPEGWRVVQD
jgi:hypothetical protein